MIFTDEDGKKYEESGEFGATVNDQRHFVIRPIEEPKKWEVTLGLWEIRIGLDTHMKEEHGELIKEAIEQLMVTIFDGYPVNRIVSEPLVEAIDKARKALKGDI